MATVQLKRALTCSLSFSDAISKIRALEGDNKLKCGEPMIVRYVDDVHPDQCNYMMVICTSEGDEVTSPQLTILPTFSDLDAFAEYIRSVVPDSGGGAISAAELEYLFSDEYFQISGSNQQDFNIAVLDILSALSSRMEWKTL